MSGEGSVVKDECGERWVRCVYEALFEMSERSSVRCVCVYVRCCVRWMRWVVWNGGERWVMSDEWIKTSGVRTAAPNTVYTQQGAKPACQQNINAKFPHLLLAQLPWTQFTHSKAPNPHASKTSTQNFRISYWPSYPEHSLHTARRQTRMPGRHQRKISASPIGPATPNTVYIQQAAKPAWQRRISKNFSQHRHLLCKCQYNSGDTDLVWHLLCKRQYNNGGTDMSHRRFLCKRQYNCGNKPAGAQRRHRAPQTLLGALDTAPATQSRRSPPAYCTCHTKPPGPSGDTARRNPF